MFPPLLGLAVPVSLDSTRKRTKIRQGATLTSVDKYCINPGVRLGDNDVSAHIKCPQPSALELDFIIPSFLFDEEEAV